MASQGAEKCRKSVIFQYKLTIKYVHEGARWLRVAWNTGVVSRMAGGSVRDGEGAGFSGQLSCHVDPPIDVVVNHAVVVVPEYIHRRLGALKHGALQLQPGARFHMLLRWPRYFRSGL